MSKTSVRKWLELAHHLGMLPVEKSNKQRVLEAIQTNPKLSYTQIGKQLGISKTMVLYWKNILLNEKLIAVDGSSYIGHGGILSGRFEEGVPLESSGSLATNHAALFNFWLFYGSAA
jgi:hypothetical protein